MSFFAITGLLNGLGAIVLGLITFFKRKKSNLHRVFALLNLAFAIWALSYWRWLLASNYVSALFWTKILSIGSTLIPILFLHWVLLLVDKVKEKKMFLIFGYFITAIFLAFAFSPLFVKTVEPTFSFAWWPKPGVLYHFYIIFSYILLLGYSIYQLFIAYRGSKGHRRAQMKYVFLGLAIAAPAGFSNFPLWYGINFPPYLNVVVLAYMGCYTYAMLQYRLMDIRLVISRTVIYLSTFVSVVGVGYGLLFLNNSLKEPFPFNIFFPAIIVIAGLGFKFLFNIFERVANRYFYYTFYSYQKVLNDLGKQLTQILDIKKLSVLIVETLQKTMRLDKVVVLIRRETGSYAVLKNVGFKGEGVTSLAKDKFLTKFLQESRSPLVFDELALLKNDVTQAGNRKAIKALQKNMQKTEATVCLPLFRAKSIMGLIILGGKISRDAYSKEDLGLLDALASQASIAIENAQLYGQVNDLSFNLQQKVDEQTKELVMAYNELKRTNRLKTEFLGMSSHQLRTLLTIIKGYLSMTLEGDYGKIPPKIRPVLENVYSASQRLVKIVGDLLNISRIDLGKMNLENTKIQIHDTLQSCYEEMKIKAEEKGLKIIYKQPSSSLPKIDVDESKIRQVISNLIDNSIRYTMQGQIVITVEKKKNSILIKIKDTGVGLSKDEQKDIFEGFTRGTAGINHFTEGAGLGLYISKKYLDLHKGKIWSRSPGKGKGSTFYVEIPIT